MTRLARHSAPALLVAALWPVWRWVLMRWTDGTAEAPGLVSWALAIALLIPIARRVAHSRPPSYALPTALMLAYALAVLAADGVPPIVRAGLGLGALAAL